MELGRIARAVLGVALLGIAPAALAAPVQWRVADGGNDHFYNVVAVSRGIAWPAADAAAKARGSAWHLATITSPEENAFVYGLVAGKPQFWAAVGGDAVGPWLGAVKSGPGEAEFRWSNGEEFSYTNWAPGQPTGIGDRIVLFGAAAQDGAAWSKVGSARQDVLAYVIETEQAESLVAVLEEPSCAGASGVSNIRGFAFSSISGVSIDRVVEVTFDRDTDDESETDLACCSSRGDVRAAIPVAPVRSGFSGVFNWCLLPPGKHTITLRFESSTGKTLGLTREFVSYCEHPDDPFLVAGEFDWQSVADGCRSEGGGTLVCRPRSDVCDGEVRYAWSQASQGLVLRSGCEADASNPSPPACSDEVVVEVGEED